MSPVDARLHSGRNVQAFSEGNDIEGVGIERLVAVIGDEIVRAEVEVKAEPDGGIWGRP